jgi:protocadherin Fat 1/2/3
VIVAVLDENDNPPQFLERFYKIQLPETLLAADDSPQQDQEQGQYGKSSAEAKYEQAFENSTWESFTAKRLAGKPVFRVFGYDKDKGANAWLTYSIKNGQPAPGRFQIHPESGEVYATASLYAGEQFELLVQVRDGGSPSLFDVSRVSVEVVGPAELIPPEDEWDDGNSSTTANLPSGSCSSPPRIADTHSAEVFETDPVGHLVVLLVAESEAEEGQGFVFFDIVSGNAGQEFSISRDKGSLLIARPLDWERQQVYSLNVSVTDVDCQMAVTFTQVNITVSDVNELRPEFAVSEFRVDIPENVSLGSQVAKVNLKDGNSRAGRAQKHFFSIHAAQSQASMDAFKIHPLDGTVTLRQKLDHEQLAYHVLTVAVKDNGAPPLKNYARLIIKVWDNNDHAPQFLSPLIQTKLFETADIGSALVQVQAVDMDRGENGRLTYSIVSGNIGNAFAIEPDLGTLTVVRSLDMGVQPEYMLMVKVMDHGLVPLSATVPVHVLLTMAEAAEPRFQQDHYATEVFEDLPRGHFVIHVAARSQSALFYEIVGGNSEAAFQINPSTGIISTQQGLDFERQRFYNLTVQAANNMVAAKAKVFVDIHILDVNDNPPRFERNYFQGNISESAPVGSLVLVNNSAPLVVRASDRDSGLNSLLLYEILEEQARQFFTIDSSTGALRTISSLDYETQPVFQFNVRVSDMGKPRLSAETTARVRIFLQDQNDSPPAFDQRVVDEVLLLPTFTNVTVTRVNASDPDQGIATTLRYSISGGNEGGIFGIDSLSGTVFVLKASAIGPHTPLFSLSISVTDGKFSDQCKLNLVTKKSDNSGLVFSKAKYYATVLENSTKVDVILVLNVLGSALNENLEFRILSPTDMFSLGRTSGALSTTGRPFDREEEENYELIVEVRSEDRSRHTPR